MTRISGVVFIAVGAIVTLFSNYVRKRGGEGLALFFWVGIAMIGIGIFKIVSGYILNEKKKKTDGENRTSNEKKGLGNFKLGFNRDLEDVGASELEKEKQKAINNIQTTSIIVCPVCGTKHYSNSNFCHMCGTRLK